MTKSHWPWIINADTIGLTAQGGIDGTEWTGRSRRFHRQLRSYAAAHRDLMSSVEHRQSKYLNNRAENSHHPPASENKP